MALDPGELEMTQRNDLYHHHSDNDDDDRLRQRCQVKNYLAQYCLEARAGFRGSDFSQFGFCCWLLIIVSVHSVADDFLISFVGSTFSRKCPAPATQFASVGPSLTEGLGSLIGRCLCTRSHCRELDSC